MTNLPPNVYHVAQLRFDAIPDSPWVYWLSSKIRNLFEKNQGFGEIADVGQGMTTGDNTRFLRYWWELRLEWIGFGYASADSAKQSGLRWFPYMKGGGGQKWYGQLDFVINWWNDGLEIKSTGRATIRNSHRYFHPGITWSSLSSSRFSARLMPTGFLFDDKGSSCAIDSLLQAYGLALLNSSFASYALNVLNPSISVQSGDIKRLPAIGHISAGEESIDPLVLGSIRLAFERSSLNEITFDFTNPSSWHTDLAQLIPARNRSVSLEVETDEAVYRLYGVSDEDRAAIEAELAGEPRIGEEDEEAEPAGDEEQDAETEPSMTREELAVRWSSYALGVVLGRFRPGLPGELGCAVYRRQDFAVGSLPEPDEDAFDALVGPPERFAYVDPQGGRHLFSAQVEEALRELAVPDGITVLDEGHPRDLPALVARALALMLSEEAAQEVIAEATGDDLRRFLERDFFTKWHLKWYRKRPIYWPLQSAKRSYGFILFHERISESTLYVLQRDHLDHKLKGLELEIGDLQRQVEGMSGAARKRVERQMEQAAQLLEEIGAFGKTIERIAEAGYKPQPNWIDDGVILRMAPLWELIPIWKSEPKKYWDRLQKGEYDWSHIAMNYWPGRVREKCKTNKSYAIAHGHEEWCEGKG